MDRTDLNDLTRRAAVAAVVGVPSWRGLLHAVGAVATIPAGVVLILSARSAVPALTAAVFTATLTAVFATSAYYHRGRHRNEHRRELWRRLDHSMIFMLIAGTYTPVCLLGLPQRWGVPLLIGVWVTAAAGIAAKLVAFHSLGQHASILYVVLGWVAAIAVPQMLTHWGSPLVALLVAGGVCYTAGAVVLAKNYPNPAPATFGYHEIWHAATIVAAGCHLAMVLLLVR